MADDDEEVVDNTAKANRADMNKLGGGGDDDGGIWVDPNATHVGMISPHGRFRVGWDLATALLLVYVAVIEPLRLGWPSYFASENGEGQWRNQASTVPFRPLSRE